MSVNNSDWKKYEVNIYNTIRTAFPDSEIEYDDAILGIYSKVERQVDFAIRKTIVGKRVLGVVDCKYFGKNIDLKIVESFIGMIEDLNANFGILITNKGYSQAAKNRVKFSNLKLDVLAVNELNEIIITSDYFINQNIKGLQLSRSEFLRRGKQNSSWFDEVKSDYKKRRIVFKEGYANYQTHAIKKIYGTIARSFRDFEQLESIEVHIPAKKNDESKYIFSTRFTKQSFENFTKINFDYIREDIKFWREEFVNSRITKEFIEAFESNYVKEFKYEDYYLIEFEKLL
ncbi:restriction endonuclease [Sphingobacterium siyangense]|uniref:restriction endonuclease n=1 Tax=Sphingobacterium siyangense TaxID=459529 RepID=UPI003DA1DE35